MVKRFKSKKKRRLKVRFLFTCVLILGLGFLVNDIMTKSVLTHSNEQFILELLSNSNYHIKYENNNIFDKIATALTNINFKKPVTIMEKSLGYDYEETKDSSLVYNKPKKEVKDVTSYIKDPNPTKIEKPLIYIYNTHQSESYQGNELISYEITPNVMMASYLLKEKLNKSGVPTIVEESNVSEFLRLNNWNFDDSYKASRVFLMDTMNKYNTVKLYIDLHRDSLEKKQSTITIDKKNYAKLLFVIGKGHKNYKENEKVAQKISDLINKKHPGLSRGVMTRKGSIYNQDLSTNAILIELGANKNNVAEVLNTTDALSVVLKQYLGD